MKLYLVLQCINFWDFTPVEKPLKLCIDGIIYPYTAKKGGYYIITKPLPDRFTVSIYSESFHTVLKTVAELPADKVLSIQMFPKTCPPGGTQLRLEGFHNISDIVLGYGYYRVTEIKDGKITVKNPYLKNLEGRYFLLRDTKTGREEFITFGPAMDIRLQDYSAVCIKENYAPANTIILPAAEIPVTSPGDELREVVLNIPLGVICPVWLYAQETIRLEVIGGQTTAPLSEV